MQDIELMHMRYALEFAVLALGAMERSMIDETGSHHQVALSYLKDLRNHLEAVNNIPRKVFSALHCLKSLSSGGHFGDSTRQCRNFGSNPKA